jgi:micrococcal nuclease
MCDRSRSRNCVIDGDTIRYRGEDVRIANLDAPEIFDPECSAERALGIQAKQELLYQLNKGPFQLVRAEKSDKDKYGRKLRLLKRDGRLLGDALVSKGLARKWSGTDLTWCG